MDGKGAVGDGKWITRREVAAMVGSDNRIQAVTPRRALPDEPVAGWGGVKGIIRAGGV